MSPRWRTDDWDFALGLSRLGDLVGVDRTVLLWRRHPNTLTNSSGRGQRRALLRVRRKALMDQDARGCDESAGPSTPSTSSTTSRAASVEVSRSAKRLASARRGDRRRFLAAVRADRGDDLDDELLDRADDDQQVERDRPVLDVEEVEAAVGLERRVVAGLDLPQAGDARRRPTRGGAARAGTRRPPRAAPGVARPGSSRRASTLNSCGSSSRLVLRRNRPIRVTRGSSVILNSGPLRSLAAFSSARRASASTSIVRNLRTPNCLPSRPTRTCRKSTGPRSCELDERRRRRASAGWRATSARRGGDDVEGPLADRCARPSVGASMYSSGSWPSGVERIRRASMPAMPVAMCTWTPLAWKLRISSFRRAAGDARRRDDHAVDVGRLDDVARRRRSCRATSTRDRARSACAAARRPRRRRGRRARGGW